MGKSKSNVKGVVLSCKVVADVDTIVKLNEIMTKTGKIRTRINTDPGDLWGIDTLQTVRVFEIYNTLLTHEELLKFLLSTGLLSRYIVIAETAMKVENITALQAFRNVLNESNLEHFIEFTGKEGSSK